MKTLIDIMPCWQVDDFERVNSKKERKPYCNYTTDNYFRILRRIDNIYIEGFIGRNDREEDFLNDVRESLTYLQDFFQRKKVYFTFDRINLYELVEIYPSHPNPIRFILKRIDGNKIIKKGQAFMIMPFHNEEMDNFFKLHIRSYLSDHLNVSVYRSDDFQDNDIIVQTIYSLIEESEFVIAEITNENKNAFYELGYASAIGAEIITIQNKNMGKKLFFDRAHIRTIFYDTNNIEAFYFELTSTIKSIRDRQ